MSGVDVCNRWFRLISNLSLKRRSIAFIRLMGKRILKIGDRVRYTRNFLQCIGAYTGWYPQARGVIVRFVGKDPSNRLAVLDWDVVTGVNDPKMVNVFNLEVTR